MPRLRAPKEDLFSVALTLFSQRGFSAVSVREICSAAGVRESSLYNHYASKQALLDRVIEEMGAYMHSPKLVERQPERWRELGLRALLMEGLSLFLNAWSNARLRQLWMTVSHEQYRIPEVAMLLQKEQENRIRDTAAMFQALMLTRRMKAGNAQGLAAMYVHAMRSYKLEFILNFHHGLEIEGAIARMNQFVDYVAELWEM